MQETWVQSLGWEDPLEKEMATHSSTWGRKESDMAEPLTLPHSSCMAGRFFTFSSLAFPHFLDQK